MAYSSRPLAVAFLALLVPIRLVAQDHATITQGSNLRTDPSTHNPPIQTLAKGAHVTVLEPKPMNGFYHVRTPEKKEGWVWSKNLNTGTQASQKSRKLVRRSTLVETEVEALGAGADVPLRMPLMVLPINSSAASPHRARLHFLRLTIFRPFSSRPTA